MINNEPNDKWYEAPTVEIARQVAKYIDNGGVVIFPGDTVYGIFGNALDPKSFERVYEIKKRDRNKPFVIYTIKSQVDKIAQMTPMAETLIQKFWPNEALSVVLYKKDIISDSYTHGRDTVAIMSAGGEFISEVLRNSKTFIFGTTCNISGMPEITKIQDTYQFKDEVDLIVGGDHLIKHSVPSTIVDCTGSLPKILRESSIPSSVIFDVCNL